MIILVAGLQGIPRDYGEAAEVFGAGFFQRVRHVTLPMLKPSSRSPAAPDHPRVRGLRDGDRHYRRQYDRARRRGVAVAGDEPERERRGRVRVADPRAVARCRPRS